MILSSGMCVVLHTIPKQGTIFKNGTVVSSYDISKYESILDNYFYVEHVADDNLSISISSTKRKKKKNIVFYPIELFKIADSVKKTEILEWLFTSDEIPQHWEMFKGDIEKQSYDIENIFMYRPHILNKIMITNSLWEKYDIFDKLKYYQRIIYENNIKQHHIFNILEYRQYKMRDKFITECLKIKPTWNRLDAISVFLLNNYKFLGEGEEWNNSTDVIKNILYPKAMKNDRSNKALFSRVDKLEEECNEVEIKLDDRYIDTLTQEIIDKEGLILFNIHVIESKNKVLFIFIDKYNNKRLLLQDFHYDFYISSNQGIINNDFIVLKGDEHYKYRVNSIQNMRSIQQELNNSWKKFMKEGNL